MDLNNEGYLKNKDDLHIAGRHMALNIFRSAVFFSPLLTIVTAVADPIVTKV